MRLRKIVAGFAVAVALQGCTFMDKVGRSELRHSGGYPGRVLDRHFFNASGSKELQLLRMSMLVALASRVGVASIRDGREADAFVDYLANASDEVNFLAGHLYGGLDADGDLQPTCVDLTTPQLAGAAHTTSVPVPTTPWGRTRCATYAQLFESEMPDLEYKVMRLLLAALPQQQAADLASSIRSGNVFAVAWKLLKLASASLDGAHRGAAVYRTSQEVLAVGVLASKGCELPSSVGGGKPNLPRRPEVRDDMERVAASEQAAILSVEDATDCLGRSRTNLWDDRGRTEVTLPRRAATDAFHALFAVAFTSCRMLPFVVDPEEDPSNNDGDNSNARRATDRREKCKELTFQPRLRFGAVPSALSVQNKEANKPNDAQQPDTPPQPGSGVSGPGS